jgi:hypothetical protein
MSERPADERGPESAIEELAEALRDSPLLGQAVATTLSAGERALAAQKAAISILGLSSSDDLEQLGRRLRSLSNRVEAVEDAIDGLEAELIELRRRVAAEGKAKAQPEDESPSEGG